MVILGLWLEVSSELQPQEAYLDSQQKGPEVQPVQSLLQRSEYSQGAREEKTQSPGDSRTNTGVICALHQYTMQCQYKQKEKVVQQIDFNFSEGRGVR